MFLHRHLLCLEQGDPEEHYQNTAQCRFLHFALSFESRDGSFRRKATLHPADARWTAQEYSVRSGAS
jgi:hypothetical protein